MFTASKTTKAKKSTRKATKRARKAGSKAAKRAEQAGYRAGERAAELAERAGEGAQRTAAEAARRLRDSEALARAQVTADELAGRAKGAWHGAHLDERTAELAERVRESEAAQRAADRTRQLSETGLAALGAWLASGPAAGKLGVKKRRSWPVWLVGLLGVAVGFAAARFTADRSGADIRNDLTAAADRLASRTTGAVDQAASAAGPTATVLADTVRVALQGDPRTASVSEVNINVAEGTVFVRGEVPSDVDQDAIRDVIRAVPGVRDVDLQLGG